MADLFENLLAITRGQDPRVTEESKEIPEEEEKSLDRFIFTSPESFEYPSSLGDVDTNDSEQLHSVRFTILARENSRVATTTGKDTSLTVVKPSDTGQNNLDADTLGAVSKGAGVIAGFTLGAAVAGKVNNASGLLTTLFGLTGAVSGAALTGEAVIERINTVRTLGSINLFISQPPVSRYSANWENKELGALAGLGDAAEGVTDIDGLLQATKGVGELAARGAIKAAANLPGGIGIGGELGSALELASKKVANPYKEQLFTSIGFRQFAFNYKFAPKNDTEYKNVKRIIDLFKYHMHPENSVNSLFLQYPSEFEIEYLYKGERNENLNKISSCALTDIKVTYGNQDAFTTFKNTNGKPAEINLELAFTELETLTNDRIADGY
tara:strand:+ start:2189 stop:3337 length:1149 start_codon:yes stop_codon:yes gene_type:complete